tara:strand:- start:1029 stop:1559 length:531 start_codon:yes stop_codon:yes gene_type:complete
MILKSDPLLIKNPFILNTKRELKTKLGPDNTQLIHDIQLENGNKLLHNPTDPKLSFTFGKNEEISDLSFIEQFDYEVPAEEINKTAKVKHKDGLPLSFLQIETEEEGIEWYSNNYPKLPDELLPIIARYHWGEPITKKAIKNEKKKILKKLDKQGIALQRKTKEDNNNKPFIVSFD